MDNMLSDGSIIPSYLGTSSMGYGGDDGQLSNLALRQGEVLEIIQPGSDKSRSKKLVEYRVLVDHRDGDQAGASIEYPNCVVANTFGGTADFCNYTLRAKSQGDGARGNGSKVTLLCINGDTSQGLIVGGIHDTDAVSASLGHNLSWEFNGIFAVVNADGELKLGFSGATKNDGTLVDGAKESDGGTSISMEKDGALVLSHDNQSMAIDHQNQALDFKADKNINTTAQGDINSQAQGTANFNGEQGIRMDSNGTIETTSAGVKLGADEAVDALVRGTTYRAQERIMHESMQASLATMISLVTTMATSMSAAAAVIGVPFVGGALAAPNLVTVGVSLTGLAAQVANLQEAISQFEAGDSRYLSGSNYTE